MQRIFRLGHDEHMKVLGGGGLGCLGPVSSFRGLEANLCTQKWGKRERVEERAREGSGKKSCQPKPSPNIDAGWARSWNLDRPLSTLQEGGETTGIEGTGVPVRKQKERDAGT